MPPGNKVMPAWNRPSGKQAHGVAARLNFSLLLMLAGSLSGTFAALME
jgi:hypothetical protein